MDFWKFFSVGHADLRILNPTSAVKLDELIELLAASPETRVLDIACGKAEFLVRAVARWECTGVGVDLSPSFAADARERVSEAGQSSRIEIVEENGAHYDAEAASFDVVSCLGASWIWGGYPGTLDALTRWARPGGLVISGEPYWKKQPDAAFCEAEGVAPDSFGTHHENVQTAVAKGLGFLHAMVSSDDEWDRYEGYQWRAAERYAHAHREDPDASELLRQMRTQRDNYLHWGRDTLGWAIYLFMKDPFP
jgi:SAM-dependent methyltransferase